MTVRRFLRSLRVTVGDADSAVRIDDLFVRFRIRREATATPAEGFVDIYNLNESNETRIRERAERVIVEAGYGGQLDLLFDGDVRRVERERADLDRITRVHVGGYASVITRSIFIRAYEGAVSVRDIVRDGVAELGLDIGPVDLIPADATETDFRYNGPTYVLLTKRLDPFGVQWYEEDGVIRFTRYRRSADDRPASLVIGERTGMIGTPTVTDDGVRVRTLLDARLRLDSMIRIESSVLERAAAGDAINQRAGENATGVWKVIAVEHRGDNREGDYSTTVEARPVLLEPIDPASLPGRIGDAVDTVRNLVG